jgi:ABC-2 type transport system permease protein
MPWAILPLAEERGGVVRMTDVAQEHHGFRYSMILLRAMVVTDFRVRYQASMLGYLWTLLRPLALFTILYLVFVQLLRIGAGIPYNAMYLLFGIVIWGYFGETTTQGLSSLVARATSS